MRFSGSKLVLSRERRYYLYLWMLVILLCWGKTVLHPKYLYLWMLVIQLC